MKSVCERGKGQKMGGGRRRDRGGKEEGEGELNEEEMVEVEV